MILRVVFRIGLLALGLGLTEIGLVTAMGAGSQAGWLVVLCGLALLVAGGAGFMVPLLGDHADPGERT